MGAVNQYQILNSHKKIFELKEVCALSGVKETPLLEIVGMKNIDCMGKMVNVFDFCSQQFAEHEEFLRGIVEAKKVVCHFGQRAVVQVGCSKDDLAYCKDSLRGCAKVKRELARNLRLFHHGIAQNIQSKPTSLTCVFHARNYQVDSEIGLDKIKF